MVERHAQAAREHFDGDRVALALAHSRRATAEFERLAAQPGEAKLLALSARNHRQLAEMRRSLKQQEQALEDEQRAEALLEKLVADHPERRGYVVELTQFQLARLGSWTVLEPEKLTSSGGATLTRLPDGSVLAGGTNPQTDSYTVVARTKGGKLTGLRLELLQDEHCPIRGPAAARPSATVPSRRSNSGRRPPTSTRRQKASR